MSDKKVISISGRPFEPAHSRKERAEAQTKEIIIYMRELHEVCAKVGKPRLLSDFLNALSSTAITWWFDDKEKRDAAGSREGKGSKA